MKVLAGCLDSSGIRAFLSWGGVFFFFFFFFLLYGAVSHHSWWFTCAEVALKLGFCPLCMGVRVVSLSHW